MVIRDAIDEDWPSVGSFCAAIVEAGTTYAYPENLSSAQARDLWMAEPPGRTVVAVRDERIVGSATMGPNRPGRGSHVATASFMVDPEHHGRGTGRALGRYVIDWARASGYRGMQFHAVVETNRSAVHLWQELGFEILATVPGRSTTGSTATSACTSCSSRSPPTDRAPAFQGSRRGSGRFGNSR